MENKKLKPDNSVTMPELKQHVQIPSCGRIVHFFPSKWATFFQGVTKLPAVVLTDNDMSPDLAVYTGLPSPAVITVKTVGYKGSIEGEITPTVKDIHFSSGCWDWPERK